MILWYHHLALPYNQGMLGGHLKLCEVLGSMRAQRQRGLMPAKLFNELPHQKKSHVNSGQKSKRKKRQISLETDQTHHIYRKSLIDREKVTTIIQDVSRVHILDYRIANSV